LRMTDSEKRRIWGRQWTRILEEKLRILRKSGSARAPEITILGNDQMEQSLWG